MYKCELCGTVVPAGMRAFTQVVETRRRVYPPRPQAHPVPGKGKKSSQKKKDDPGGIGVEIVKEALVCAGCAGPQRPAIPE